MPPLTIFLDHIFNRLFVNFQGVGYPVGSGSPGMCVRNGEGPPQMEPSGGNWENDGYHGDGVVNNCRYDNSKYEYVSMAMP